MGTKAAIKFLESQIKRGLHVYLFEIADFYRGSASFNLARKLMSKMVSEGKVVKADRKDTECECFEPA